MKALVMTLCLILLCFSRLHAQAPFYAGKTIRIVVGLPAGDAYDLYARTLAAHMPKHIPGRPTILVQNMPGASTMIAANHVYSIAKPDGLTLGSILPSLYFDQLLQRKEVQFDWTKFAWIGSFERSNNLLYMRADTPFKTIHDVVKTADPPKCGSTGTGSPSYYLIRLLNDAVGTKFNIVTGYKGGQEIDLAVERGEVHCRSFTITTFFAREPFHTWRRNGFVRVLTQTGKQRDSRLADVPTVHELMDHYNTPESTRRLAILMLASGDFGRPIIATPGIPSERVKLLREAFANTMRDPEFLAEIKKKQLEVDPMRGEEIAALANEVLSASKDTIERMAKLLGK